MNENVITKLTKSFQTANKRELPIVSAFSSQSFKDVWGKESAVMVKALQPVLRIIQIL